MLEWQPDSAGTGVLSRCGRYSASPAIDGPGFIAYRLAPWGTWFAPLARAPSLDAAKDAAQIDAEARR